MEEDGGASEAQLNGTLFKPNGASQTALLASYVEKGPSLAVLTCTSKSHDDPKFSVDKIHASQLMRDLQRSSSLK